jgi:hypothetical protein
MAARETLPWAAGVWAAIVFGACTHDATEVMVRVDSDIATVREGGPLERVTFRVGRVGETLGREVSVELRGAANALPGDYLVTVEDPDDTRLVRVEVTGVLNAGEPVRREFEVRPVARQRRLLRAFLADRCRPGRCAGVASGCAPPPACPPGTTCGRAACELVTGASLAEYTPLPAEDAATRAVVQCERGTSRACYTGPASTRGRGVCRDGRQTCTPAGAWGPCEGEARPLTVDGGVETIENCDGRDENCDGEVDERCCIPGSPQDRACYDGPEGTADRGVCRRGVRLCNADGRGWGACAGQVRPEAEVCNGFDDDCNGQTDEDLGETACMVGGRSVPSLGCVDGRVVCPVESCAGRACGRDLSGASCGTCEFGTACTPDGRCLAPECNGRHCGTDRNGIECGVCPRGERCANTGRCVSEACGPASLSVYCTSEGQPPWWCPTGSTCNPQNRGCPCAVTTFPLTCEGQLATGGTLRTDLACSRGGAFCGRGAIRCASGGGCPAHSICTQSDGGMRTGCLCESGYHPTRCLGIPCVGSCDVGMPTGCCPGADYYCSPN